MQVADTSFLYALFSRTDEFHARALKDARGVESLLIPAEILSETIALIQYRQGFPAARSAGAWIQGRQGIQLGLPSRRILARAWRTYDSSRGRVSYPDAVVLAWCAARAALPLAYDSAILRMSREAG